MLANHRIQITLRPRLIQPNLAIPIQFPPLVALGRTRFHLPVTRRRSAQLVDGASHAVVRQALAAVPFYAEVHVGSVAVLAGAAVGVGGAAAVGADGHGRRRRDRTGRRRRSGPSRRLLRRPSVRRPRSRRRHPWTGVIPRGHRRSRLGDVRRTHRRDVLAAAVIGLLVPEPLQVGGIAAEGFGEAFHAEGAYARG